MKRFLVSILAVLYLASASGATVHLHYCMGKLIKAGIATEQAPKRNCDNCGMVKKASRGCCKDEYKLVKTDPSNQAFPLIFTGAAYAILPATVHVSAYSAPFYRLKLPAATLSNAPPNQPGCPIYKRLGNFRI